MPAVMPRPAAGWAKQLLPLRSREADDCGCMSSYTYEIHAVLSDSAANSASCSAGTPIRPPALGVPVYASQSFHAAHMLQRSPPHSRFTHAAATLEPFAAVARQVAGVKRGAVGRKCMCRNEKPRLYLLFHCQNGC